MNKFSKRIAPCFAIGAAALVSLVAGSTVACPPDECEGDSGQVRMLDSAAYLSDLPVKHRTVLVQDSQLDDTASARLLRAAQEEAAAADKVRTRSSADSTWTLKDDKSEIRIEIRNGVMRVWRDGELMGEQPAPNAGGSAAIAALEGMAMQPFATTIAPGGAFAMAGTAPRVMMGITMDSPSPDVLEVLNHSDEARGEFNPEAIAVVTSVMEGLPAEQAGLRERDVIIGIDGSELAGPEHIREVMSTKQPGDSVELRVFRDGDIEEIEIELGEYDADAFGGSAWIAQAPSSTSPGAVWSLSGSGEAAQRLEAEIAAMSRTLSDMSREISETTGRESMRLAREMSELGESLAAKASELARSSARVAPQAMELLRYKLEEELSDKMPPDVVQRFFGNTSGALIEVDPSVPGQSPRALVLPAPPSPPAAPAAPAPDSGSEDLDRRLDRLERMLEKLLEERESKGE